MARIRIDADGLRQYIRAMDGRIGEYDSLNTRAEALKEAILSSWTGDAGKAFDAMMVKQMQQAAALGKILVQFRNYAQNAADKFEDLDTECASRIRNSF